MKPADKEKLREVLLSLRRDIERGKGSAADIDEALRIVESIQTERGE